MAVLPTGIGPVTGYNIERSLRFNSADSAYLNRTFVGTPNTYTLSMWIKRSTLGTQQMLVGSKAGASTDGAIQFQADNTINVVLANTYFITTTAVYRDPSAWYHIVLSVTASGTAYLYVNNTQVGSVAVGASCWLFNSSNTNAIGRYGSNATLYYNGYLTEVNFIDGQALTPSSFGETDSNTGVWKPKRYTGTYGTNGFYLKFADNSGTTSTTLGKDSSGNGNNWTPNNFSVTAGAGNDSLVDTPTSYGTDTGAGGEVRGNYATLNPLDVYSTAPTNGNLDYASSNGKTRGTLAIPKSGKWYWEVRANASRLYCGLITTSTVFSTSVVITSNAGSGYYTLERESTINKFYNASTTGTSLGSATISSGDVMCFAYDADTRKLWIGYGNGSGSPTWYSSGNPSGGTNELGTLADAEYSVFCYDNGSVYSTSFNFGQRPFAYTAPSGFKALCTQNLPTPTIGATSTTQANDYMNVVLYTGNGYPTSGTQSISGVGFQPDFVWIKSRTTGTFNHFLQDAVRGSTKVLRSNTTGAENTESTAVTAFNSDGFSLGATNEVNQQNDAFVSWNWKANGTGSTNTAGTITSTVSANTTSGFSIVTYTGTAASATVGHGLGVKPAMIIIKKRTTASPGNARGWAVWHQSLATDKVLQLNTTAAQLTEANFFIETNINTTTFGVGADYDTGWTDTYVAYCFAEVAGYSKFGSYTGNGSSDGPFVYTGFRPRYVLIKRTDTVDSWDIWDSVRNTYNAVDARLYAQSANAETSSTQLDILSNGFKLRSTNSETNYSASTYIYAAFAESPFKYSLAR